MNEPTLDEKIEVLAQQLAKLGIPIDRARAMLRNAIYAPPTEAEIEDAVKQLFGST